MTSSSSFSVTRPAGLGNPHDLLTYMTYVFTRPHKKLMSPEMIGSPSKSNHYLDAKPGLRSILPEADTRRHGTARRHHQRGVARVVPGRAQRAGVRGGQGRRGATHEVAVEPVGRRGRQRERHCAGLRRHRHERSPAAGQRAAGEHPRAHTHRPMGHPSGLRGRHRVLGRRGLPVCER